MMKKDNDLVWIDAPPAREASGLQIKKAEYGYSGNWTDVTDAVQNLVKSDGSIDVKVGFKELGIPDPNPNKQKQLQVEYTINGAQSVDILNDAERFRLSAPPREDTSGPSLNDHANSIGATLFMGVAQFFGVFLYALSVLVGYRIGNYFIHPIVWGALAFFLPFFSFWGLPFVIFFARLFTSQDLIPA